MRKIKEDEFNRMVFAILVKYSIFLEIPIKEVENKITQFSKQLTKNEELIQHGQDDQITK